MNFLVFSSVSERSSLVLVLCFTNHLLYVCVFLCWRKCHIDCANLYGFIWPTQTFAQNMRACLR